MQEDLEAYQALNALSQRREQAGSARVSFAGLFLDGQFNLVEGMGLGLQLRGPTAMRYRPSIQPSPEFGPGKNLANAPKWCPRWPPTSP